MKNKIKDLRVRIDGLAQLTKELKPITHDEQYDFFKKPHNENSKEIEKATDSLYLAKAWLGTILGLLGSETSYSNNGNRTKVEDIEPTADISNSYKKGSSFDEFYTFKSHIEKVDWLREEIKDIIDNTEDFSENIDYIEVEQSFAYKYLCEARFWLGAELGRIRDEKN